MSHERRKICIDVCVRCAQSCEHCAPACLGATDVKMMAECSGQWREGDGSMTIVDASKIKK